MGPVWQNPIQRTVRTAHLSMCLWLCTDSVHNATQNSSDNLPSYLTDKHHSSDVVYRRRGNPPLIVFASPYRTCFGSLPSTIRTMCPNRHRLLFLINSNFCSVVFSRTSSFRTLFFPRDGRYPSPKLVMCCFQLFSFVRQTEATTLQSVVEWQLQKKDEIYIHSLISFPFAHAIPASITKTPNGWTLCYGCIQGPGPLSRKKYVTKVFRWFTCAVSTRPNLGLILS